MGPRGVRVHFREVEDLADRVEVVAHRRRGEPLRYAGNPTLDVREPKARRPPIAQGAEVGERLPVSLKRLRGRVDPRGEVLIRELSERQLVLCALELEVRKAEAGEVAADGPGALLRFPERREAAAVAELGLASPEPIADDVAPPAAGKVPRGDVHGRHGATLPDPLAIAVGAGLEQLRDVGPLDEDLMWRVREHDDRTGPEDSVDCGARQPGLRRESFSVEEFRECWCVSIDVGHDDSQHERAGTMAIS